MDNEKFKSLIATCAIVLGWKDSMADWCEKIRIDFPTTDEPMLKPYLEAIDKEFGDVPDVAVRMADGIRMMNPRTTLHLDDKDGNHYIVKMDNLLALLDEENDEEKNIAEEIQKLIIGEVRFPVAEEK